MATIVGNQIKLNNGKLVDAQQGGWFDGQQYWGGTLSAPGQINTLSNQPGAGQDVSKEVVQQTNPANWDYIQKQKQAYQPPAPAQVATTPSYTPPGGTPSAGVSGTSGASGIVTPQPTINLPDLYKNLYGSSGISDIEKDLSTKTLTFNEAVAKIKDNPYLSEAKMQGRLKKLSDKFEADTLALKNDIATKKADIETQLNLQTKQFDINSQVARDALSQFNTLLSMGALDNANGEDIANITRSTGISSDMIYSAVKARQQKNINTQVITSTNDAGIVTATVLNQNTGEIIKQTNLGAIGNAQTGITGQSVLNETAVGLYSSIMQQALASGATPEQAVQSAVKIADQTGTKIDLKTQGALLKEAQRLKGTSTPTVVTPTPQPTQSSGGLLGTIKSFFSNLFGR